MKRKQFNSGIQPYTGTFGKAEVLHLLRRTMFGATKADVTYFMTKTLAQSVAELLTVPTTAPAPPLKNYSSMQTIGGVTTDTEPSLAAGQTWVNTPTIGTLSGQRRNSLRAWWMSQMINQNRNILEKMTLFWHHLVPVQFESIGDPVNAYNYTAVLRANALGNYKTLIRNVTTEAGMLVYLNGYKNTKNAPDENYGRELQELFTVGKDLAVHYTEDDVKTAARVLTGWRYANSTNAVTFDVTKHDTTNKTFSAFYNNTVITGQSDPNAGATELDAMLTMIFAQPEVAKYICRRLYRFFVYYDIDATIEAQVITPLADVFRQSGYNISTVMSTLLQSQHFFDVMQEGCIIKSPADFVVNYLRQLTLQFPTNTDLVTQYYMWYQMWGYCFAMQQAIGDPPNVAGWAAYYQVPSYHETWINADTLRNRKGGSDGLLAAGITKSGFKLIVDPFLWAAQMDDPSDVNALIAETCELMHTLPVSATVKQSLKSGLLAGQTSDYYWTNAYNDATNPSSPNYASYRPIVKNLLLQFLSQIMNLAEYQLG